jgi:flagellar motor switch protein FliN/FliY
MSTVAEDLAIFANVPMNVDVELDRRKMTLAELLRLDVNSVLKMHRSAGENLDIRIGGAMIGCGEIVISETTTGVRITDFDLKE